jgi:hypothetical protein
MKKYTENIEALQENAKYTAIDTLLKSEISSLYPKQDVNSTFLKEGLKAGEPTAIEVLQKMKVIIEKFTKEDSHGCLELKSQTEIESNS